MISDPIGLSTCIATRSSSSAISRTRRSSPSDIADAGFDDANVATVADLEAGCSSVSTGAASADNDGSLAGLPNTASAPMTTTMKTAGMVTTPTAKARAGSGLIGPWAAGAANP